MSRRARWVCWAWLLAALGLPREAAAGTVLGDLVADYVPGVNAGDTVMPAASGSGQWRYLASETLNPTDAGASLADLQWDTTGQLFERPGLNHTDGFSEDVLHLGTNAIVMHPANLSGDFVVARWIAGPGEAGEVDLVGSAAKGDPGGGDGIRFVVFVDGVSLFDEVVAFDDTVGVSFALRSVAVDEGSTADFVVGKVGDSFFDTTFVSAVITPAPEPSAPLLALLGAFVLWGVRGLRSRVASRA
jgi:hypothetical protein